MLQDDEEMSDSDVVVSTKKWKVAPRISRVVPFGYKIDPDDPDLLLPIPLELEALERARRHLKNYSYRDVAKWVEEVTGRYISHIGLRKRVDNDRKNRDVLKGYKLQAKRIEKIIYKIEKANGINSPED